VSSPAPPEERTEGARPANGVGFHGDLAHGWLAVWGRGSPGKCREARGRAPPSAHPAPTAV